MVKRYVLWNPTSGKAQEAAPEKARLSQDADTTLEESESPQDARRRVAWAVDQGFNVIVAAGGDGTINSVANGLVAANSDVTLGVLPIGTANDFALSLGLPDRLDEATDTIFAGQTRQIDVVELETTHQKWRYANVAAGGNSDRVSSSLDEETKATWGPFCYLRGALDVLTDMRSFAAEVELDDEPPLKLDLWNVIIANGRTNAGHLRVAPRANLEDGLLDVVLVKDGQPIDMAKLTAQYLLSDFLQSDLIIYRQVRRVQIKSDPQMRFSIDGEPIDEQPVVFRNLPGAVRMIVGPHYSAAPPDDA